MENPPKKFFRLSPGAEVRLRYAYFITCREVVKNAAGEVIELRCTYDPGDQGRQRAGRPQGQGDDPLGLGAARARPPRCGSTITLFAKPDPTGGDEFRRRPQSEFARSAGRRQDRAGACRRRNSAEPVQFERQGYFTPDPDSSAGQAGVQPHRRPARHLCQSDRRRGQRQIASLCECARVGARRHGAVVGQGPDRNLAARRREASAGARRGRGLLPDFAQTLAERLRAVGVRGSGARPAAAMAAGRVRSRHRDLFHRRARAGLVGRGCADGRVAPPSPFWRAGGRSPFRWRWRWPPPPPASRPRRSKACTSRIRSSRRRPATSRSRVLSRCARSASAPTASWFAR